MGEQGWGTRAPHPAHPAPSAPRFGQHLQADLTWSHSGKRGRQPQGTVGSAASGGAGRGPCGPDCHVHPAHLSSAASKRPRASSRSTLCSSSDLRSRASVRSRRARSWRGMVPTSPPGRQRRHQPPRVGQRPPSGPSRDGGPVWPGLLTLRPLLTVGQMGGRSRPDRVPSACGWLRRSLRAWFVKGRRDDWMAERAWGHPLRDSECGRPPPAVPTACAGICSRCLHREWPGGEGSRPGCARPAQNLHPSQLPARA